MGTNVGDTSRGPIKIKNSPVVDLKTGELSDSISLPSITVHGKPYQVRLIYSSSAARPGAVVRTEFSIPPTDGKPKKVIYSLAVGGDYFSQEYVPTIGEREQHYFWPALMSNGSRVRSGSYPYLATLTSTFPGVLPNGKSANFDVDLVSSVEGRLLITNKETSPFGAGWTLDGDDELIPNPDGTAYLIENGDNPAHLDGAFALDLVAGHLNTASVGGDGGPARSAQVSNVAGIAVDKNNNVYFSDGHRIRRISSNGVIQTIAGGETAGFSGDGGPATHAFLKNPTALAVDGSGQLYFVDQDRSAIRVIDPLGTMWTRVGIVDGTAIGLPAGSVSPDIASIAVTPEGDLFFSNTRSRVVLKLASDAVVPTPFAGGGKSTGGEELPATSASFDPGALAYSVSTNGLYVSDLTRNVVRVVDSNGTISVFAGGGDSTEQHISATSAGITPHFLSVDATGNVYIGTQSIDVGTGALLQYVDRDGLLRPVAGSLLSEAVAFDGSGTQTGSQAFPNSPGSHLTAIAVGPNGRLYYGTSRAPFSPNGGSYLAVANGPAQGARAYGSEPGELLHFTVLSSGGWQTRSREGAVRVFDTAGRIKSSTDANGRTRTFTRDTLGRLTAITDSAHRTMSISYSGSKLSSITDPAGRTTNFVVDGAGDLVSVTMPDQATWNFGYRDHLLISKTSPRGFTTRITYRSGDVVASIREPDGGVRAFTHGDEVGLLTKQSITSSPLTPLTSEEYKDVLVDANGKTQQFVTDEIGQPRIATDTLGRTITRRYDNDGNLTEQVRTDGSVIRQRWDSRHNLLFDSLSIASTAPLTRQVVINLRSAYEYESTYNRPVSILDPRGARTAVSYDARGNLTSISEGRRTDGSVLDGVTRNTSFTWSSDGLLTSVTGPRGLTTKLTHNAIGNVATLTDAADGVHTLTYDDAGDVVVYRNTLGAEIRIERDRMGRPTRVTDPADFSRTFRYDGEGNLIEVKDERYNSTSLEYTSRGDLSTVRDPFGRTRSYEYDPERRLRVLVDEKGRRTTLHRDSAGRVERVVLPSLAEYRYSYDALDNVASIVDPEGRRQRFLWNSLGLPTGQFDGTDTLVREDVYSAAGDLVESFDGRGASIKLPRDLLGQVTAVVQRSSGGTEGLSRTFTRDGHGNVVRIDSTGGRRVDLVLDKLDRPVSADILDLLTGRRQTLWKKEYDSEGNLVSLTNGNGATWSFQHDSRNLTVLVKDPETPANETSYKYDGARNLTKIVHPGNQVTALDYDALNRKTKTTADGVEETYSYDETGQLTAVSGGNIVVQNAFDLEDRLIRQSIPALDRVVTMDYDLSGRRTQLQLNGLRARTYSWDQNGRIASASMPGGLQVTFSHDATGRVTRKTLPNNVTLEQTWDGFGRLARQLYSHPIAGVLEDLQNTYDFVDNIAEQSSKDGKTKYTYDFLDQLLSASHPGGDVESYQYDSSWNRSRYTLTSSAGTFTTTYAHSAGDRVLSEVTAFIPPTPTSTTPTPTPTPTDATFPTPTPTPTFPTPTPTPTDTTFPTPTPTPTDTTFPTPTPTPTDTTFPTPTPTPTDTGLPTPTPTPTETTFPTLTPTPTPTDTTSPAPTPTPTSSDGTVGTVVCVRTYRTDPRGNLVSVTSGGSTTGYSWDGLNRLTGVTFPDGTSSSTTYYPGSSLRFQQVDPGGRRTRYVWDPGTSNVLEEIDATGAPAVQYMHGFGMDEWLARIESGAAHTFISDQVASTRALVDGAGTKANSYTYRAFGEGRTTREAFPNLVRFTGRELDFASRLVYMRGRWLDRRVGRLISPDPIGFAGGLNLYSYVANNPISRRDPLGLGPEILLANPYVLAAAGALALGAYLLLNDASTQTQRRAADDTLPRPWAPPFPGRGRQTTTDPVPPDPGLVFYRTAGVKTLDKKTMRDFQLRATDCPPGKWPYGLSVHRQPTDFDKTSEARILEAIRSKRRFDTLQLFTLREDSVRAIGLVPQYEHGDIPGFEDVNALHYILAPPAPAPPGMEVLDFNQRWQGDLFGMAMRTPFFIPEAR